MTYDELVNNLRNYTEIDSNVFTDSVINTFITFAENKILRAIDLDIFKKEVTANMSNGNRFLTAEQEFLEHRETSFLKEYWKNFNNTGSPKYYSVFDSNTFYIAPTPNNNFLTQLGYIARPTQLSASNPTTWISKNAPEALFYAVLSQAYSYTKGPLDMLQFFEKSFAEALQGLGVEQQGRRRRDEYRDGELRTKLKAESPGP